MKKITTLILGFALLSQCFGQTAITSTNFTDALCFGDANGTATASISGTGTAPFADALPAPSTPRS